MVLKLSIVLLGLVFKFSQIVEQSGDNYVRDIVLDQNSAGEMPYLPQTGFSRLQFCTKGERKTTLVMNAKQSLKSYQLLTLLWKLICRITELS